MNPRMTTLMPLLIAIALGVPTAARADDAPPEGASAEAIEVASNARRPAARPVRRPAARRAYRPVTVRRAPVYRPARGRVVYAPTYRPVYGYGPPVAGVLTAPGTSYLSLGGQLASISGADGDRATEGFGGGAGFELGYGFRPAHTVGLETAFGMTFHDIGASSSNVGVLGHLTVDVRVYLGREDRALQPYVLAGLGAYFTGRSDTADPGLSGLGFQAGGGLDYFLAEGVSVGVKGTYRGAFLDDSGSTLSGLASESAWLSTFNLAGDLKLYF
jgi:opacity protein-like surface antigen